ncbi:MAG: DUF885 domain-containing protein [Pyrinomonadaceae bacterium]|nr:DUF885 domain-containing protein [Pyrinomonadaceae bacterium]
MRSIILLTAIAVLFSTVVIAEGLADDNRFETIAKAYIEELLRLNPETATVLGDHRYDARLTDYSLDGIKRERAATEKYLADLGKIDARELSTQNSVDYRILREQLESRLYAIDTLREREWNPLAYNPGNAIFALVAREFAPLGERLMSVKGRLAGLPAVVAAAKANLKNPPRVHTETAIIQNKGNIALITTELEPFIARAPELRAELAPVQAAAKSALEDYGRFLEKDLLPRSTGDFRIGDQKFRRKLAYALSSDLSKEEIMRRAQADLQATQGEMYQTALPLYRKFFPAETDAAKLTDRKGVIKAVLAKLAGQRPTNESIVPRAKDMLRETTEFVRGKNLVTVPSEPLNIIVMPEFQRGVAVAYCDSAGPLETNGETFYAISPTPADWKPARVESFFREYNDYMLRDLTIHEAMPGHYLQLMHSNKFRAPTLVRAIFGSGTFVEGWAVYAEQVMAEHGYGGAEVKMQQLKMRLRLIINAMLDQSVHTAGMAEGEAMRLMIEEGFQEEGEAAGKWRRACLSSSQLSTYYVGSLEVGDIHRAYEAKHGRQSDMKRMHDQMLSFGSPAPKYVKELMGL